MLFSILSDFAQIIAIFAIAYGLGSIPFGLLLTRMAGMGDIRRTGSGNIGATNVLRSGHKMLALSTLLLDAGKGMAAVLLVRSVYIEDFVYVAALLAVLGHAFPVWLKFHGGKGVATSLGVLIALNPLLGGSTCLIWIVTFLLFRMSSLASLTCIWASPILAYALGSYPAALLCMSLAALLTVTHRANITRLLHGTEPKFR